MGTAVSESGSGVAAAGAVVPGLCAGGNEAGRSGPAEPVGGILATAESDAGGSAGAGIGAEPGGDRAAAFRAAERTAGSRAVAAVEEAGAAGGSDAIDAVVHGVCGSAGE